MKHLVLQDKPWFFVATLIHGNDFSFDWVRGVWRAFLQVCAYQAPSCMGLFLFSPFVCWHLEVFRTICVNSLYSRVSNTLPDTLLQMFFLTISISVILFLSCKAFLLLYFWIWFCVVCVCDLYLPAWNFRSYHSLQRTDEYFAIFFVCFHLTSSLDSLISLEFLFWSVW